MERRSVIRQLFLFAGGMTLSPLENLYPGINNTGNHSIQLLNQTEEPLLISNLRPRIFVRANESKVGRGLTLTELRGRINNPAYSQWISYNNTDYNNTEIKGLYELPSIAMQYLLYGRKNDALNVYHYLVNNPLQFGEYTSAADAVYNSAIAFDWIRDALSDNQAERIIPNLIRGAEYLKPAIVNPSINHNYTQVSLFGVAMVAIAIYGEGENNTQKARKYMELIEALLEGKGKLLDTFKAKKGTWTEGNHYSPYVVFHSFLMTLRGLTTATNRDYFKLIKNRYDDFIAPMSKFVIVNFRPDFTLERIGDVTKRVVPYNTTMRPLLELLASEISDTVLQGQVRSFSKEMARYYGTGLVSNFYNWMMMIVYDPYLPDTPSYKTLPLAMRLGEGTYEHIMFRSHWKENATLITCVSGWHFTDHQHFDKGSFLIYKKGGLTVDGGGYSKMYRDSWANYSTRTLAHNCVIVHDPDETPYTGIKTKIFPDGGQNVIRGSQSQSSWQEYLKVSKEKGLNTAKVLSFGSNEQYNYVKSDLTNAYGKNVTRMERQLLYFPEADYLIVKDLVITRKALDKYWLLHFEEKPMVDDKIPSVGVNEYDEAQIVMAGRTGELTLTEKTIPYSGKLFIKPILPLEKKISVIGGPGYEYYNGFIKKNFPPERPFPPIRESGRWRVEVSSKTPGTTTTFLHALEITDKGKKSMVPTKYIKTQDNKMEGVQFLAGHVQYVGFFCSKMGSGSHPDAPAELPVHYNLEASAPTVHVLTELWPNKSLVVRIDGHSIGIFTTTDAGVLSFTDQKTGRRNIEVTDH